MEGLGFCLGLNLTVAHNRSQLRPSSYGLQVDHLGLSEIRGGGGGVPG